MQYIFIEHNNLEHIWHTMDISINPHVESNIIHPCPFLQLTGFGDRSFRFLGHITFQLCISAKDFFLFLNHYLLFHTIQFTKCDKFTIFFLKKNANRFYNTILSIGLFLLFINSNLNLYETYQISKRQLPSHIETSFFRSDLSILWNLAILLYLSNH